MSPSIAAQPLMRRSALQMASRRVVFRRFESSSAAGGKAAAEAGKEAASKAASTASEYGTKAAQGLSRVTSAAGPAIVGAAKGVTGALGRVGGRTGKVIAFAERQVPFVVYYSKVGLEVAKLVFHGQKMAPPSVSTFQAYFQNAWKAIRNPGSLAQTAQRTSAQAASQPASVLNQVRNLSRAQLIAGGVIVAECLGFFTVGEMIGRFKLVGYHGETGAHH